MSARHSRKYGALRHPGMGGMPVAGVVALIAALALQGCFDPVYPQLDREQRVMEALDSDASRDLPPSPLTAAGAVAYALEHSLDAKVAEIEAAYQNESLAAARRRLLPSLTLRYSPNYANHPSARWSESTRTGSQALESSYSSEQTTRQSEVGAVWNLIDFGVGYFRSRQQGERILNAEQQRRRVRQQVVLDVLSAYWRAAAAARIAGTAGSLRAELDTQAKEIRDSVDLRILSGAEGARRELAVYGSLAELELYGRQAAQTRMELARVLGCGSSAELSLAEFDNSPALVPETGGGAPRALQAAALKRRPELFQQDAQERIAVDEARLALLQIAPNANLSLNLYHDPDKFIEWNNWMTAGVRASWNLLNIPTRLAERRVALLQKETAKRKGMAVAAAVMAQVGIAFSDWRLSRDYAAALERRAAARERLVDALAAGEKDGQTRPGEVLQERVRLLSEKAAAIRAEAEVRVAGARLVNAIGLDADADGNLLWQREDAHAKGPGLNGGKAAEAYLADVEAGRVFPDNLSGLRVIKAEEYLASDESSGYVDGLETDPVSMESATPAGEDARDNAAMPVDAPDVDVPAGSPPDGTGDGGGESGRSLTDNPAPGKARAGRRKANQLQTMAAPGVEAMAAGTLPKTAFSDNFDARASGVSSSRASVDETMSTGMTVYDAASPEQFSAASSMPRVHAAAKVKFDEFLPEPVPLEDLNASSAGSLPFATIQADAESLRRGAERQKALEPLRQLPRPPATRMPANPLRSPAD